MNAVLTTRKLVSSCLATVLLAAAAMSAAAQTSTPAPDALHIGDRIALTIEGAYQFSDTVSVREGYIIRLPSISDINVSGVTRQNAQQFLSDAIGKYVKDAVVHATPLVRLSVSGQVAKPGFYSLPSDMQFSDVVMRAGGPTSETELGKTVVKRNGIEVIPDSVAATALNRGQTLDQLMIASGDEVVVGEKSKTSFLSVLQVFGIITPIFSLIYLFKHH